MEDFECGKKTRRKLRLNELKSVQVDTTDPIATAFSSGQYGHGSRVFAKVRDDPMGACIMYVIYMCFVSTAAVSQ